MKTKWFKSLFYFGLAFFSLLILASTALTPTIIVPDDYSTIQAAINAATYGDTVYVRAGTYSPSTNGEVFPINMRNGAILSNTPVSRCSGLCGRKCRLVGADENIRSQAK